jgi:hypothetical protein
MFYSHSNSGLAIVATTVDNLTISMSNDKLLKNTKNNIKGGFNMKDISELYWLLNIKIKRDRNARTISLSQDIYVKKILKYFNLQDAKVISMPIDPNTKLTTDQCTLSGSEKDYMRNILYYQAVGSLM